MLDTAGQKGTGKWTSVNALDMGTPAPTVAEAVFARCLSAVKDERVAAEKILKGPEAAAFTGDKAVMIEAIREALYASKICSYAQGFQLMAYAQEEYDWKLNFGEIAQIFRGGCIIRAAFLQKITEAYESAIRISPTCYSILTSLRQSTLHNPIGVKLLHSQPNMAFRFKHLVPHCLTTTVTEVHGFRKIFYKPSATTSVLTPTNALTKNAAISTTLTGQNLIAPS